MDWPLETTAPLVTQHRERSQALAIARQGWRFARAYRTFARHPVDVEEAKRVVAADLRNRERRFVENLDRLVWPYPHSPARRLLELVGAEPGDVRALVAELGLEGALCSLRDQGVYVSYEESLGRAPARRGSAVLEFRPDQFANPTVEPDFLVSSSGTRSEGTLAQSSFGYLRRKSLEHALRLELWGVRGAPTAYWGPAFPGGGIGSILKYISAGNPPERWFTQVKLGLAGVSHRKRIANGALVCAAVLTNGGLPRPRYVPATDPEPALDWLQEALIRSGRALGCGYPSSWTHLALVAAERGISLSGAAMGLSGEPVTPAKIQAVEATGARVLNVYSCVPEGNLALSCPEEGDFGLHVWEHDYALVTRRRPVSSGSEVSALCVTTLATNAPRVLLNVENDDAAELNRGQSCGCLLGSLDLTTRLSQVHGISKVVTGGTTMPGELLEPLAEKLLPERFGGGPTDFQFFEEERNAMTSIALRVDPRLGPIDEAEILATVTDALSRTEAGVLSSAVWSGTLRVVRAPAASARSGKVFAFERLQPADRELV